MFLTHAEAAHVINLVMTPIAQLDNGRIKRPSHCHHLTRVRMRCLVVIVGDQEIRYRVHVKQVPRDDFTMTARLLSFKTGRPPRGG